METRSHVSPLRRWVESILVWYSLFMVLFLLFRFVLQSTWRFILFLNNLAPYLFGLAVVGLVISLLLRRRRLSGVYVLVTLIGALWIGSALLPPLTPLAMADASASIKLVTINVYPNNDDLGEMVDWLDARNPQVIALQDLPEDRTALADLNDTHPHIASQEGRATRAIYSQFPILESSDVQLAHSTAQRVVLDVNEQAVVIYNVHLFMPLNDRDAQWTILRYDEKRRNEDVAQLLGNIANETEMVIVTGDLNLTEWSPVYNQLTEQLTDAYRRSSWGIGATWPADASEDFGAGYPRLFRIDYVLFTEPIEVVSSIVGSSVGSDHLPLIVELVIP
ncbi:MAG: endonuclease/exonuclease/phosphatase family protein [Chloroflexota bacterium]